MFDRNRQNRFRDVFFRIFLIIVVILFIHFTRFMDFLFVFSHGPKILVYIYIYIYIYNQDPGRPGPEVDPAPC